MIFKYDCPEGTIKVEGDKIARIPYDYHKFRLAMITGISNGFSIEKEDDFVIGIYDNLIIEVTGNIMFMLDLFFTTFSGKFLALVTKDKMEEERFYWRVRAGY